MSGIAVEMTKYRKSYVESINKFRNKFQKEIRKIREEKKIIKECPFCKKQFTQKELDDLFMDDKGFMHCPDCGTVELDDVEEEN